MAQPCQHCGALKWSRETASVCCSDGKVILPRFPDPPPVLSDLWFGTSSEAKLGRELIRPLNNALCMSSVQVKEKKFGNFTPSVIFQGKVTQFVGSIQSEAGETPRFSQLYTLDSCLEETYRVQNMTLPRTVTKPQMVVITGLMRKLQAEIAEVNPFIRDFKQICEIPEEELTDGKVVISARARPQGEHERRYNLQVCRTEISIIHNSTSHDLVLMVRGGGVQKVSDINPNALPLHFTLLFPHGTQGWSPDLRRVGGSKRVTPRDWLTYYLNVRDSTDYLFSAGRLFQEFICFGYVVMENQRLSYQLQNQVALRADTFKNVREALERRLAPLEDRMGADTRETIGRKIILASSFIKGKRWYNGKFQDGMAICRKYRKPDLFITMTCNPHWEEITKELKPGQTAQDRPDLVSRVFKMKKDLFVEDMVKNGIFGKMVAFLYVIEYQKVNNRSLCHFITFNVSTERPTSLPLPRHSGRTSEVIVALTLQHNHNFGASELLKLLQINFLFLQKFFQFTFVHDICFYVPLH